MRIVTTRISDIFFVILISLNSPVTVAGSFLHPFESGEPVPEGDADNITHPEGYLGVGGELIVNVCIAPDSQDVNQIEIATENVVRTWNSLIPTTGNVDRDASNGVVGFDFESVLLHEVGHCIGLDHVNLASDSGVASAGQNYTRSGNGGNGIFNLDPGADNVIGSSDDIRGDDINLHWFQKLTNNPFTMPGVVDASTYSVNLEDLPAGHNFAANADRDVANLFGFPNTEAVMQQGTFTQEAQRTLAHDDVATFRLGMSGIDKTQGTADDYSLRLNYIGVSNAAACDITIKIDPGDSSFAFCSVGFLNVGPDHRRLFLTNINFGGNINWHYNQVSNNLPADLDGDGLADSLESNSCTDVADADTDDDGLEDGVEDANRNGVVDSGETDPCNPDSDNDNIQDGTELGIVSAGIDTDLNIFVPDADPSTTTLPTVADTDADGFDDGDEDLNANGRQDPGESDPNNDGSTPTTTTIPIMPALFLLLLGLVLVWSAHSTRKQIY